MATPEIKKENTLDDIQSVNVKKLSAQYISPIERLRSMSAPAVLNRQRSRNNDQAIQRDLDSVQVDNSDAQESRAHTFYRMIGLPVIAANSSFYNPGFNPERTRRAGESQVNIADNVSQVIRIMHEAREFSARARRDVFRKAGIEASVHSLVLLFVKPFQVIDANKLFNAQDDQIVNLPERKKFLESKYKTKFGSDITIFKDNETHILRPFLVDPTIEGTVMPAERLICEPFLKNKDSTKLEENTLLKRPIIELILRSRLREFAGTNLALIALSLDAEGNANVEDDLENASDIRTAALALLRDNNLNDPELEDGIKVSDIQLFNITKNIKTINKLVDFLIKQVEVVNKVSSKINWTPISNEGGPEFGTDNGTLILLKKPKSKLEKQRLALQLKNIEATIIIEKTDSDIGTFAGATLESQKKTFVNELSDVSGKIDEFIRMGSNALLNIEVITGEISGLGLVDILAIYTALWAIDLNTLLTMIDDAAFTRLFDNNPDLRAPAVVTRKASGILRDAGGDITIESAMERFDSQVISILAYADKLLVSKLTTQKNEEAGNPVSTGN